MEVIFAIMLLMP